MGRSQISTNKKEVRTRKEKKRKEKEQKRLMRKESEKKGSLEDMLAYVDENGIITTTPPDPGRKKKVKLEDIEIGVPRNDGTRESSRQRKGVVTFFNTDKGFGFIRDSESGEKVFVHVSDILEEIKEGKPVSYVAASGKKGRTAIQVRLIKD